MEYFKLKHFGKCLFDNGNNHSISQCTVSVPSLCYVILAYKSDLVNLLHHIFLWTLSLLSPLSSPHPMMGQFLNCLPERHCPSWFGSSPLSYFMFSSSYSFCFEFQQYSTTFQICPYIDIYYLNDTLLFTNWGDLKYFLKLNIFPLLTPPLFFPQCFAQYVCSSKCLFVHRVHMYWGPPNVTGICICESLFLPPAPQELQEGSAEKRALNSVQNLDVSCLVSTPCLLALYWCSFLSWDFSTLFHIIWAWVWILCNFPLWKLETHIIQNFESQPRKSTGDLKKKNK